MRDVDIQAAEDLALEMRWIEAVQWFRNECGDTILTAAQRADRLAYKNPESKLGHSAKSEMS